MHKLKEHSSYIAIFCLLFLGLLYAFIFNPSKFHTFFPFQDYHPKSSITETSYIDALESALAKASTEDRTLIIAIVNKAYVEGEKSMLDMFMDGFWLGEDTRDLIDHLLLVTVDQTSFDRCKFLRLHCFKLETDGVDFKSEEVYMSDAFIRMMWRRTLFLGEVLKREFNFIFTDTDVMWLRNPFPILSKNESIDLQISTDNFNGDEWSESNPINTGFYMVRSNNKTISLFNSWYARKENSTGLKEQDVLDRMMHEGVFGKLGLKVRFLNTQYFSGFCQNSKNITDVVTVHANCCRTISAKITDLRTVLGYWKKFKGSDYGNLTSFGNLRHEACVNSWK